MQLPTARPAASSHGSGVGGAPVRSRQDDGRNLPTTFAALDVETANPDPASICQVGIVTVESGRIASTWSRLVNPGAPVEPGFARLHGITDEMVGQAPGFGDLYPEITSLLPERVVTHTSFDVRAIREVCRRRRLPMIRRTWLDSAVIAARAWPRRFGRGPRGLAVIAADLGIRFRRHDAGEDARAAAEIVLLALRQTGRPLEEWRT